MKHIALLAYPEMTALDLIGPHHVLSMVPGVKVHLVAKTREPVASDMGLLLTPSLSFDDCPDELEVLFTPGGTNGTLAAMEDSQTLAFLRHRGAKARWVSSVCTGSLLLGAAGLLDGYRATSHWSVVPQLARFGARPVAERVVRDVNRLTGAGVTAGLDFGLTLVAALAGEEHARKVQLLAEYDPAPPFDAGSPASAGAATTAALRTHLARFVADVEALADRRDTLARSAS